jgi:hypothetical protein
MAPLLSLKLLKKLDIRHFYLESLGYSDCIAFTQEQKNLISKVERKT